MTTIMRARKLGNFYGADMVYPSTLFGNGEAEHAGMPNWSGRLEEILGEDEVPRTSQTQATFEQQYFSQPQVGDTGFFDGTKRSNPRFTDAATVGDPGGVVEIPATPFKVTGATAVRFGKKIKGIRGQEAELFKAEATNYELRHDTIRVGGNWYALYSEKDYTKYRNILKAQSTALKKIDDLGIHHNHRIHGGTTTQKQRDIAAKKRQDILAKQQREKAATFSDDEASVILKNEDAQAVLINNMMPLVHYNGFSYLAQAANPRTGKNPHPTAARGDLNKLKMPVCYVGEPQKLMSYLVNPVPMGDFVHATSAELSLLVPMLRFYFTQKGKPDKEIKFPDHTNAEMIKQLAALRNGESANAEEVLRSRGTAGTDVGITGLRWTYDNKHFGEHVLKLTLELYFGTLLELLNGEYLDFVMMTGAAPPGEVAAAMAGANDHDAGAVDVDSDGSSEKQLSMESHNLQAQIDLMLKQMELGDRGSFAPVSVADKLDRTREMRELKVDVGWALPDITDEILPNVSRNFMDAVQATQKSFKLQLTKYDLDFGEMGEARLRIDYVSSIGAYYTDPRRADVLSIEEAPEVTATKQIMVPFWLNDKENLALRCLPNGYIYKQSENLQKDAERRRNAGYTKKQVAGATNRFVSRQALFPVSQAGVDYEITCLKKMIKVWTEQNKLFKLSFKDLANDQKVKPTELKKAGFSGDPRVLLEKYKMYLKVAQQVAGKIDYGISQIKYSSFIDRLFKSKKMFFCAIRQLDEEGAEPYKFLGYGAAGAGKAQAAALMKRTIDDLKTRKSQRKKKGQDKVSDMRQIGFLDPNKMGGTTDFNGKEDPSVVKIFYMRLGDIVDASLECVNKREDATVLLGSFSPTRLGIAGTSPGDFWSIADIPISLEYFGQWFMENIAQKEINQMSVKNFLDKLLLDMAAPAINQISGDRVGEKISFDFGMLQTTIPLENGSVMSIEAIKKAGNGVTRDLSQRIYQYLVVNTAESTSALAANRKRDEEAGIYHLVLGADRGIAKKFSFSEKKMPRLRALNIEKANWAGALVIPQDCEVVMVGNNLFQNGQLVYIDASMGLGDAVARKLKIGGYYRVVKSTNRLRAGKWDTSITCMYEADGNP